MLLFYSFLQNYTDDASFNSGVLLSLVSMLMNPIHAGSIQIFLVYFLIERSFV